MAHDVSSVSRKYFWGCAICHGYVTLRTVSDVLQLLRLGNRRLIARELTTRGYPVSGETLNRWVRQSAEVPEPAARYISELFGVDTTKEAPRPKWAEELIRKVDSIYARQDTILERQIEMARRASRSVIDALASPEVREMRDELDALRSAQPPVEERRTEDSRPGK